MKCMICMDEIEFADDAAGRVSCGHSCDAHWWCIGQWVQKANNGTCPMCRTRLSAGDIARSVYNASEIPSHDIEICAAVYMQRVSGYKPEFETDFRKALIVCAALQSVAVRQEMLDAAMSTAAEWCNDRAARAIRGVCRSEFNSNADQLFQCAMTGSADMLSELLNAYRGSLSGCWDSDGWSLLHRAAMSIDHTRKLEILAREMLRRGIALSELSPATERDVYLPHYAIDDAGLGVQCYWQGAVATKKKRWTPQSISEALGRPFLFGPDGEVIKLERPL